MSTQYGANNRTDLSLAGSALSLVLDGGVQRRSTLIGRFSSAME